MITHLLIFLVAYPLLTAFLLLLFPAGPTRNWIIRLSAAIIALGVLALSLLTLDAPSGTFRVDLAWFNPIMFALEVLMAGFICFCGFRHRKIAAPLLAISQLILLAYFERANGHSPGIPAPLYLDSLSVIMALIIGIIGPLICIYAIGYMKDFHHHYPFVPERRLFFFLLFAFLSAMFGIVFSNNLLHLCFFWEITTLCSFLLIGYTRTREAISNSFLALSINLSGGLALVLAIGWLLTHHQPLELQTLLRSPSLSMIPVALLCFAGLTKSAQMPFCSWLLGAMVAPTPTSALLHSSTMVKAGIFLLLKLAPRLEHTAVGTMVVSIGAVTFLLSSFLNIPERNAKKVLAYSTVGNLGLIAICAGIGTAELVWVGIFLMIFHAISKSLLFLAVGTTENRIFSKDIENMDHLIVRMPQLAILLAIGIITMFVAPFGMIVGKWAAIRAILDSDSLLTPVLILVLAYGSAATVFYWTKFLGKILSVRRILAQDRMKESTISSDEWISQWSLAGMTVLACACLPLFSSFWVEPYLLSVYGLAQDLVASNFSVIVGMLAMIVFIPVFPLLAQRHQHFDPLNTYLSGRSFSKELQFDCAMAKKREVTLKNYYMETLFPEKRLTQIGVVVCTLNVIIMLGMGVLL